VAEGTSPTIALPEQTTLADLLNGEGASHAPPLVTTTFENRLEIS